MNLEHESLEEEMAIEHYKMYSTHSDLITGMKYTETCPNGIQSKHNSKVNLLVNIKL